IMAFAPQMWMLVVGRAVAGITSANMAVATAYITDISSEEERARRFGLFHAMFGIGFIIGPVLGGVLGDYWVRAPVIAAAVLNGVNSPWRCSCCPNRARASPERGLISTRSTRSSR
ncbi:MAG TPA: MFS transporter, partial [Devosia sp.]|nr:MFS transporter [Devosia sp.]